MTRFVALFRGINVGKAKRIAMADLRAVLESLDYRDVKTLLNSGNAVFEGRVGPAAQHAQRIRSAVADKLGVDALVIVKSVDDVSAIVRANPLAAAATDPSRFLVALTNDAKSLAKVASLAKERWGKEEIQVGKHAAYIWCVNGILESKVAVALLKGLGETGTTRNWATIGKILGLLQQRAG